MKTQPFDVLEFPLQGLRLIEASAGTGKTFSLAGLYLRLVVEKRLEVRQILVMTFTRAATQELRERIRVRLTAAAAIAADPGRLNPDKTDDVLAGNIIARAEAEEPRSAIARRLREAAARMDEATISTIHAFAHAAARENAFDSALPFDRGTQVDDRALHLLAATDYWRSRVIGRPPAEAQPMLGEWASPKKLYESLKRMLDRPYASLRVDEELLERLRRLWLEGVDAFRSLLLTGFDGGHLSKNRKLTKVISQSGGVDAWLAELAEGMVSGSSVYPAVPDWFVDLADPKKAPRIANNSFPGEFRPDQLELVQAMAAAVGLRRSLMLLDALRAVRTTVSERKQRARQFSFNDMIGALHAAVMDGQRGAALCQALFEAWPHALVDEFQDTDPIQYQILQRIYQGRTSGSLTMIGDPKQAIYAFRGGDVFAYLQAANDAAGRYSLDTNYRSTAAVLRGVQALFEGAGSATDKGAFLIPQIAFHEVHSGRDDGDKVIYLDDKPMPAVSVWNVAPEQQIMTPKAKGLLLDATVAQICRLLDGSAGCRGAGGQSRPLVPGDIAVLVNTNTQAAEVQRALAARGVPSVCVHNASVFESEEANDLLLVLRAADSAAHPDTVRAALASNLLGLRLGDLLAIGDDLDAWQVQVTRFQMAHETWRSRGVLAMLEPLLQEAAPRVLALEDGERRMTNYLQLAELLAGAEADTFGVAGLIRWLGEQIANTEEDASEEAQQLRLESDDDLVRIATVHKVKGLQFGVVFLPFAAFMKPKPESEPFLYHPHDGAAAFSLTSAGKSGANLEARAERLRLLYVALTRAEQACFIGWGAINDTDKSALAWLLHGGQPGEPDEIVQRLAECAARSGGAVQIAPLPEALADGFRLPPGTLPGGQARTDLPQRRAPWSVFSFSRLVANAAHGGGRAGDDDEVHLAPASSDVPLASEIPLRGAAFGTAVHELLERIDMAAWPRPDVQPSDAEVEFAARSLSNAGLPLGDGEPRIDLLRRVCAMLSRTLHTPLPHIGPLAHVTPSARLVEMEFYMRLGSTRVQTLVQQMRLGGYAAQLSVEHAEQSLAGLMNGYIDLVLQADGRYWVIDYKTNDLGMPAGGYTHEAMADAVRRGHYDLQYLIYLVALHRHLQRNLRGYDPRQHLGGAQYLFLRGLNGADAATGVFVDSPPAEFILLLDGLLGGEGVSA